MNFIEENTVPTRCIQHLFLSKYMRSSDNISVLPLKSQNFYISRYTLKLILISSTDFYPKKLERVRELTSCIIYYMHQEISIKIKIFFKNRLYNFINTIKNLCLQVQQNRKNRWNIFMTIILLTNVLVWVPTMSTYLC